MNEGTGMVGIESQHENRSDRMCQNLGAASSNRVRTSQDTMDVDSVLGNIREKRK